MFFMLRPLLYRLLLRGLPDMSHPARARPPQTARERRRSSPPGTSRAPPEPTGGSSPRSADPAGGPPPARAGSALLPPRKRRSANGFPSIRSAAPRGGSRKAWGCHERADQLGRSRQIGDIGETHEHHFGRLDRRWRHLHLFEALQYHLPRPGENRDRKLFG